MKSKILCILGILLTAQLSGQVPDMMIDGKASKEVYLQSLDIKVEVTGNIASTIFTMTFKNQTGSVLEGELLFPLPDGVTVSHYALDINGKMRSAVPVEKAKATQVFEEIEQRRVDPGILERVEGNNFRTRIYPIPARGRRTISVGYEQELSIEQGAFGYRLPLDFKEAIEEFSVKATVVQSREKPQVSEAMKDLLVFDEQGTDFIATFSRKNYSPPRLLSFSLPASADIPQVIMQSASGSYYFMASCLPELAPRQKVWRSHLGIIWDASLSSENRDFEKEFAVLDRLFRGKNDFRVELYFLNNRFKHAGTFDVKNGNWRSLRDALENVDYDGGTDFSKIDLKGADEFLFFSDGLSTLSDAELATAQKKPLHCVVSSPTADYSAMKWIAGQSGAKFINLNSLSPHELEEAITKESVNFLGIEKPDNIKEVYPSLSTPVHGQFSIAGILDGNQANITLLFGYGDKIEKRIPVELRSERASNHNNVYRIWAQKKINELDMHYEKNKEELTELGKQFGLVTRNTSLMVLEDLQDYIRYDIVPPAELQAEYFRWKKNSEQQQSSYTRDMFSRALDVAKELHQWWDTEFEIKKPKYPVPDTSDEVFEIAIVEERAAEIAVVEEEALFMFMEDRSMHASVVQADAAPRAQQSSRSISSKMISNEPIIRLMPLKQDKDYMTKLTGKPEVDYKIYLDLRPSYRNVPAFYFDMSDWLFKLNDKERALRVLTSVSEIDIENSTLFRLLGYRFKEYGEYELEAYVCQKVVRWRPMEPQSYRDYALALSDIGKKQEALQTLYSILNHSFATNISMRSSGIEEVIITELNRMIALNKLNTSDIDRKLIKEMPVDIRVVINWNMNNTDIDLHVKDPNGEVCYYSHRKTEMGGRISNDITTGYGPEQFMLKKAIPGKYEVFVNYFGDTQVKAEGPSTIMVEIFTNYSGAKEVRQVVSLQLDKASKVKDGLVKIAEFKF